MLITIRSLKERRFAGPVERKESAARESGVEERSERKTEGDRARRDGPGKERDEICLRAGGSALCD